MERRAAQRDHRPGTGVPADGGLRRLAGPPDGGPLERAGLGVARDDAAAQPRGRTGRPRPCHHRARAGRRTRHHAGVAPPAARPARRHPAGRGPAGPRRGADAVRVVPAAPRAGPAAARGGCPARGGPARRHRRRRPHRVHAHPARRLGRRRRARPRPRPARSRRPLPRPARPHRRGARTAGAGARARARRAGRARVDRRAPASTASPSGRCAAPSTRDARGTS